MIKGAGDGEAIFDGDGADNLFNVMAANYNYFEGLTIRNTGLAFWGGYKNLTGSSGLTIKNCHIENVGRAIYTDWSGSKDYYIADNTITGRFRADMLVGFTGRTWQNLPEFGGKMVSEYAIKIYGQGHVVAYNLITHFHDGVDVATYGNPDGTPNPIPDRLPVSIDFYNNDISNMEDNCIESDGGAHNIRILRNRCFNRRGGVERPADVRRTGVFLSEPDLRHDHRRPVEIDRYARRRPHLPKYFCRPRPSDGTRLKHPLPQ